MILFLDAETQDTHMKKLGPGWVYGDLDVLGFSVRRETDSAAYWVTDLEEIRNLVSEADTLVAYNAMYDFGILKMWNIDINDKKLIDVLLLAKMADNRYMRYDLDSVAKRVLGKSKGSDELGTFVYSEGMYCIDKEGKEVYVNLKDTATNRKKCTKWAKEHMRRIYDTNPELIIKYANMDVDLTVDLFYELQEQILKAGMDLESWLYRFSCNMKLLMESRSRGVKVNIDKCQQTSNILRQQEKELYMQLVDITGDFDSGDKHIEWCKENKEPFVYNFGSPKQLRAAVDKLGIPYKIKKKTENAELDKLWMANNIQYPFCQVLRRYRAVQKVRRDFLDKIINLQELMPLNKRGYVYPEVKLLGAETGRYSCANPNMQQIPSKDEELSKILKCCFEPHSGMWCDEDFRQQEFRIFVELCSSDGVDNTLFDHYTVNPDADAHDTVKELIGNISRKAAKAINLGALYHMGKAKMIRELMALGIPEAEAEEAFNIYHDKFPAVKRFQKHCSTVIRNQGYVETVLGRKLYLDRPMPHPETGEVMTFEYQAISKRIQGSAADMMIEVLTKCWERGIIVLFSVHDSVSLNIQSLQQARELQQIMEKSVPSIRVPMTTKIEVGMSWGELKEVA